MKRPRLAAILTIFFIAAFFCLGSKPLAAEPKALSGSEHKLKSDGDLNASYKQIRKLYASDTDFLDKLRNSQRAWLKFRDAELEALFPHAQEDPGYYGSIYKEARAEWTAVLEDERRIQLDRWINAAAKGKKGLYLTAFLDSKREVFCTPQKAYSLEELARADENMLNGNYQRIIKDKEYAADRLFIEKLQAAQRAWLKFRDAEIKTLTPHGGSVGARLYARTLLTEDRSRQLLKWIAGVNEGDVFAGSIKMK
jgi:uncharacterized protein YecT (DUF1311 family)